MKMNQKKYCQHESFIILCAILLRVILLIVSTNIVRTMNDIVISVNNNHVKS